MAAKDDIVEAVRQSLEQAGNGQGREMDEALAEFEAENGISN